MVAVNGSPAPVTAIRFDDHGLHTRGASVSPNGRAFAYVVDDGTGDPRATQRALSPSGVGPRRDVEIPATGPVRRLMHSADGRWLAVEVAPGGGEHHQVWVVTTDPDDDTAFRIDGARPDAPPFATMTLVGWDTDWVLITATTADGTGHGLRVHPGTQTTQTLDIRVGGSLIDSWKGASLVCAGPRGYRDMLLVRRTIHSESTTGQPMATGDVAPVAVGAGDLGARTIRPLLPNDPGSVTDRGRILDQGYDHPSLVFVGSPPYGERDLDSVQALVLSDVDATYPRLLGVEVGTYGIRYRVLAERADAGLDDFAVSHDQSTVALLWNVRGRSELQILSLPDQTLLPPIPLPGEVGSELSISAAGALVALTVAGPDAPPQVHLVTTATGAVTSIGHDDDEVDAPTAGLRAEPLDVTARDGMSLPGWLYRAAGDRPPCLLYFHGGPEGQSRPDHQFLFGPLVDAGISVFAPNVRGSAGYGRIFSHADDRYGRYAGIDDVADCAKFLRDNDLADPDAIYCAGRSYGGYLTLAALTFHPELFAAGVAICGMSDLESFFRNTEPWIAIAAYTKYGHPDSDRELLRDLSPIHRIASVRAPLLVVHGAHDTNVPVSESLQIVNELRSGGSQAELLIFDDEGHEIVRRVNQRTLAEAAVSWIRQADPRGTVARSGA
ncbi:alpha/beta fold hydrolase [Gordonia sp. ABSL1-1]|uniref:S9 family peptidase n=1 Tax=Gordonia sp. ABSL1-1 TaxID=3053923 RepID=UPI0025746D76|nr:alpha/beta fold hydrolase [Gordonia sp. ABSL1-1]MDL9937907.1 alpha/beta fold hydrolase [Gordonia sp. ABSL1-1]